MYLVNEQKRLEGSRHGLEIESMRLGNLFNRFPKAAFIDEREYLSRAIRSHGSNRSGRRPCGAGALPCQPNPQLRALQIDENSNGDGDHNRMDDVHMQHKRLGEEGADIYKEQQGRTHQGDRGN